jgi:hypothetical protein
MKIHMFLGFDNLSYTVAASSKIEALLMAEKAFGPMKCYLGAQ